MRLFIGIDLPTEIKANLLEFQSELRQLGVSGSWKSQENFHITLEFLGELESSRVPIIRETLSRVARNIEPFGLSLEGIGAFPSMNRPHTLWTAVNGNLKELNHLRDEIHVELAKSGFVLEDRKFKPHITLASHPELNGLDLSDVPMRVGEFNVKEIVLFESKAIRGKRIYTALYNACLSLED